jgi:hypothetical protein
MVNSYFLLFGRKLHVEIFIADFSFEIRIYSAKLLDFDNAKCLFHKR